MTYKGECFCGTVKIEVSGAPEAMGYCHCASCRSWSGGPVNAFSLWKPEAVTVTAGAENVATYQKTIQTAFREVSDALARRGTINDELAARQRQQAATADTYTLTEARYRAGIDPFLTVLDAQRSYYSAQQTMVETKLTAARNIVTLYQSIGGDESHQATPVCTPLPGDVAVVSARPALCGKP